MKIVGYRFTGNATLVYIQAVTQARVIRQCPFESLIGKCRNIGQSCVVERQSRCARDCAGHVCDTIMHDTIDDIGGRLVGGWPGSLETAPLVDSNVNQDRTRFHSLNQFLADQFGRRGAGFEYGADDEVGLQRIFLYGLPG